LERNTGKKNASGNSINWSEEIEDVKDLRIPPSNRFEKLSGDLQEFYSIRINKQWRIIFTWNNGNANDVRIIDYH